MQGSVGRGRVMQGSVGWGRVMQGRDDGVGSCMAGSCRSFMTGSEGWGDGRTDRRVTRTDITHNDRYDAKMLRDIISIKSN
jgi:hypothetical protein